MSIHTETCTFIHTEIFVRDVEDVNVHYQVNTLIVVCQENRILAIQK